MKEIVIASWYIREGCWGFHPAPNGDDDNRKTDESATNEKVPNPVGVGGAKETGQKK